MNTSLLALPLSAPITDEVKKKRVLLVDTSHAKRDLRAEALRKLGMYVDSAADIAEARSWWRPALYDLVLINMEKGKGLRDRLCDDLRSATPSQRRVVIPEGDRTGERAIECGAVALACVDCSESAGCVEHTLMCPHCRRAVCDSCAEEHRCTRKAAAKADSKTAA